MKSAPIQQYIFQYVSLASNSYTLALNYDGLIQWVAAASNGPLLLNGPLVRWTPLMLSAARLQLLENLQLLGLLQLIVATASAYIIFL